MKTAEEIAGHIFPYRIDGSHLIKRRTLENEIKLYAKQVTEKTLNKAFDSIVVLNEDTKINIKAAANIRSTEILTP